MKIPHSSLRVLCRSFTFECSRIHRAFRVVATTLGLAATTLLAPAQTDDFNNGNDAGWSRYDKFGNALFSFPNGGYRIDGIYNGSTPLVLSTRTNIYSDFYAAVDIVGWDDNTLTNARAALGLAFRAADVGPGTTRSLVAYWTPAISGGGNRVFSIYYLWNDNPIGAVAATIVTFETNKVYRMVAKGTGTIIEGWIYDRSDLTKPVAYISGDLNNTGLGAFDVPTSGRSGLFLFSRNNTSVSATFDNYFAAAAAPGTVAAPGIPEPIAGTPQVVNRIPSANQNLHPAASGISFNATTLGGNAINASAIHLSLNGVDVSSGLNITGSANNRSVSYNGLGANQVYHGVITLAETGGKSSTNEFYFDTFTESYLTNTAKMVEAEDYNYSGGQYQNDPIPSGFDASQNQVNGNGVGYVDEPGSAGVDFFDRRSSPEAGYRAYRFGDPVGTATGSLYMQTDGGATTISTNDTQLLKYSSLGLPDYQIQHTEGGEWLNYTRLFTPGRYKVYVRLSSVSPQDVLFDEVTGDRTQPSQTTAPKGAFKAGNTGHLSYYRYFPLVDPNGLPIVLNWGGEKTFRLTMDGPQQDYTKNAIQMNYLVFLPQPPMQLINPTRTGNTFSVSFNSDPGANYRLQYKTNITDPTWLDGGTVSGDGSVKSLTDTSPDPMRFYRVLAY